MWRHEFDIGENSGPTYRALELPYVFQHRESGSDAHLQDYWAALAVSGNPNGRTPDSRTGALTPFLAQGPGPLNASPRSLSM